MARTLVRALSLVATVALTGSAVAQTNWTQATPTPFTSSNEREGHGMAYDSARSLAVIFGGRRQVGTVFGDTWEWDGTVWTEKFPANTPDPQADFCMSYDSVRGVVVLFGGVSSAETWTWDGTDWTQHSPANTPPLRRDGAMDFDAVRGNMVLFGGLTGGGPVGDTWTWDGTDWTQQFPSDSPSARFGHTMTYDPGKGVIVLFGGGDDETWEWDGTDWTRSLTLPLITAPPGRSHHAAAYDPQSSRVTIFSGGAGDDTWHYDSGRRSWVPVNPFFFQPRGPITRSNHTMIHDVANDRMVMFGGIAPNGVVLRDSWEYKGQWAQRQTLNAPLARSGHTAVFDPVRGVTMLYGGRSPVTGTELSDVWEWDGATWTLRTGLNRSPWPRRLHASAFDTARGVAVVYGGFNKTFIRFDTWEFDGTKWTDVNPPTNAGQQAQAQMVYDSARGVCVMHTRQGETWEWDGITWTLRSVGTPTGGMMAFDSARGVTVMFASDTWEYDGAAWTQVVTATTPPSRDQHQMIYDSARGVVVVFGGQNPGVGALRDTWEYDGVDWVERSTATSPSARSSFSMAYDSTRGVSVVVGGEPTGGTVTADTWEYGPTTAAAYRSAGSGCASQVGVPVLSAAPASMPWIGHEFRVELRNVPGGAPAFLVLDDPTLGSGPLAVNLAAFGLTSCVLHVQPASFLAMAREPSGAIGSIAIADDLTLVGTELRMQAVVAAPGANVAEMVLSNAAVATIGTR